MSKVSFGLKPSLAELRGHEGPPTDPKHSLKVCASTHWSNLGLEVKTFLEIL